MRKLNHFWRILTFLFVAAMMVTLSLSSCKDSKSWFDPTSSEATTNDSVVASVIKKTVESYVNPTFSAANDAVVFRLQKIEENKTDSIFYTLPEQVLVNVTTVLLNNNKTVRKKDIVYEYVNNRHVYDNLPNNPAQNTTTNNTAKSVDLGATDLGNRHSNDIISTEYRILTDSTTGKKIRVKTEKSYVE